jgi:hypothetical protein
MDRDLSARNDGNHLSRVGIDLGLIFVSVCGPYIHRPVRRIIVLFKNHQEHRAAAHGVQSDLLRFGLKSNSFQFFIKKFLLDRNSY